MTKFLFYLFLTFIISLTVTAHQNQNGYILEHEALLAKEEAGPHNGGGRSTSYNFFNNAENSRLIFRKRILHAGSSIGYHLQKEEEIYYIEDGQGIMKMNGIEFAVQKGDAVLTFPGSSHGLKQTGASDLVLIINYLKQ